MYKTPRKNEPILNFSAKVKKNLELQAKRGINSEDKDPWKSRCQGRLIMHPTQLNLPALLAVTTASLGSSLLSSVCGVICLQLFINLISHPEDFKGVHMPALPHHKLLQIQNWLATTAQRLLFFKKKSWILTSMANKTWLFLFFNGKNQVWLPDYVLKVVKLD